MSVSRRETRPDPRSACARKRWMGVYCARATCCTKCHELYLLRVRAYLMLLIETWPKLKPTWKVLLKLKGSSFEQHRRLRREFTKRLGRRQIEYALVAHLKPGIPHEHGFIRGGKREEIVAAMKRAAIKAGVELDSGSWSVTSFASLEGFINYVSQREKVYGKAPKGWRVLTTSWRFSPVAFKDGQIIAFKRKLRTPDRIDPKLVRGLQERLKKRYMRFAQRYGVDPAEIAGD